MKVGDHIKVNRGFFEHHGIYVGGDRVVHFSGLANGKVNATIRLTTVDRFAAGGRIEVVAYNEARCFASDEVAQRALQLLGAGGYHLQYFNCEVIARWCKTGEACSEQVDRATATAVGSGAATAATAVGVAAISSAGAALGLSGAGIMSGLAATGSIVGGGAVAGLGTVGALPAVAATVAVNNVYKDDPALPDAERLARRNARIASTVGAGAGSLGSMGAVYAAGVTGLSAAGISSGLAAIGAAVGGGMLAGVVVVASVPAVAAAAVAWLTYKVSKK